MTNQLQRTAFFDLGNVILHFSHDVMCEQLAKLAGAKAETIRDELFASPLIDQYERGSITTEDVYKHFCGVYQVSPSIEEFTRALSDIFTPNNEILEILDELKSNGIKLIALSNTCPAHFEYAIENYAILKHFDDFILSYEVGARKPEIQIFQAAFAKSASEIKNCFYTDDIEEYVICARKMGVASHTFSNLQLLRQSLNEHGFLTKNTIE